MMKYRLGCLGIILGMMGYCNAESVGDVSAVQHSPEISTQNVTRDAYRHGVFYGVHYSAFPQDFHFSNAVVQRMGYMSNAKKAYVFLGYGRMTVDDGYVYVQKEDLTFERDSQFTGVNLGGGIQFFDALSPKNADSHFPMNLSGEFAFQIYKGKEHLTFSGYYLALRVDRGFIFDDRWNFTPSVGVRYERLGIVAVDGETLKLSNAISDVVFDAGVKLTYLF